MRTKSPVAPRPKHDVRKAARTLEKMFEDFELDPLNPDHWNRLQKTMIEGGYFGRRRGRGRPNGSAEWDFMALWALAMNWQMVVLEKEGLASLHWPYSASRYPRLKESAALILKRFPEEYTHVSDDRAIARRLRPAIQLWKRQREYEAWLEDQTAAGDLIVRGHTITHRSRASDDEIDAEVDDTEE